MAMIEGIGDEVLSFFIGMTLAVVVSLAWLSTNTSERPLLRTVLILERHQPRATTTEPTNATPAVTSSSSASAPPKPPDLRSALTNESNTEITEDSADGPRIIPVAKNSASKDSQTDEFDMEECAIYEDDVDQEEGENIVNLMDDGLASSRGVASGEQGNFVEPSDEPPKEALRQVQSSDEIEDHGSATAHAPSIRINLKYLNDELKRVEGSLEEQVGDFKRRHFSPELSARSIVRLVFNGKLLGQDTQTLGSYGLHDNCVVHCLVHQQRTPPVTLNTNTSTSPRAATPESPGIAHSALSNILLVVLSCLLGVAWYGRYHYAQWFTATTTVALVGVTGLFTVFLIGIYIPENNTI